MLSMWGREGGICRLGLVLSIMGESSSYCMQCAFRGGGEKFFFRGVCVVSLVWQQWITNLC